MTAPSFDSEGVREARFLHFYDLKPDPTEADIETSLSAWRRVDMSDSFLEALVERLELVRAQRPIPEHVVSTEARYDSADRPRALARVVTHPSAIGAVLERSVELAKAGELPSQRDARARREARIETLRDRQRELAHKLGERLASGERLRLTARDVWTAGGVSVQLADAYEELCALGAEEE